ncbi:hypothetical protein CTEN210_10333 [Chaetoceros tenuissimus]|uniref:PDZ domain-containing protein n=1 Tax=Chaetoceros tenuissimus TaxID=426638 RepID=A0AAD3CZ55_9STRA|nr:hypothetical protein CTEN210_10333 [Chaetoceros tenuissimus]
MEQSLLFHFCTLHIIDLDIQQSLYTALETDEATSYSMKAYLVTYLFSAFGAQLVTAFSLPPSSSHFNKDLNKSVSQLQKAVASSLLSLSILTSPLSIQLDNNHGQGIHDNISSFTSRHNFQIVKQEAIAAPLNENQQFVSDVWFSVSAQFFDPTFNGMGEDGWRQQKLTAIQKVVETGPDDEDQLLVKQAIDEMLQTLNDPYTRFLDKEKFETLTTYAKGSNTVGRAGIGVQLLLEPRNNAVLVVSVAENGPAAKAGIQRGDYIIEIDGESLDSASAEIVAAKCKGEAGTKVNIQIRRPKEDGDFANASTKEFSISRAAVQVNPVKTSTFTSSRTERKVGLLTIPAFTVETQGQVIDGMRKLLNEENVQVLAIDLRGNVGGYMPAGIDTSKLFLAGGRRIVAEVNKGGQATAYYSDGVGAETSVPLYILVDGKTASASEIFSGALQDNRRAILVGSKTFGKGRIQNVQSIGNGCGVAVTRARYVTPLGKDVHGIGITPNKEVNCKQSQSAAMCLSDII